MDKSLKIIGGSLLALAAGYAAYRWFKREEKKLDQERKAQDQELKDLGVPTDKLRELIDPVEDENNLTKMLATSTMFSPEWDEDIIDPDRALERNGNMIYVTQEVFKNPKGRVSDDLVFYFDIPNYLHGSYKDCKIGDYIRAFKDAANHIWCEYAKFSPAPRCKLVGFLAVTYLDPRNEDDDVTEMIELDDPSVYEELSDGSHDGLVAFYEGTLNKGLPESVSDKFNAWFAKKGYADKAELSTQVFDLMFKVSFKLQDQNGIGINLKQALQALKYLTEEFTVEKQYNKFGKGVPYDSVLFCAPSEITGEHDLTWYYRPKGKELVVENYVY